MYCAHEVGAVGEDRILSRKDLEVGDVEPRQLVQPWSIVSKAAQLNGLFFLELHTFEVNNFVIVDRNGRQPGKMEFGLAIKVDIIIFASERGFGVCSKSIKRFELDFLIDSNVGRRF